MPLDLSDRTWPPGFWEREGVEPDPRLHGGRGLSGRHSGFVCEGQMLAMRLGFPEMSAPIPPDEAYVTALAVAPGDVVYGGTGGRKAHLFAGLTKGVTGAVVDLCVLEENARTTAVMCSAGNRVFATTAPGGSGPEYDPCRQESEGEGAVYVHGPVGTDVDLIHEWSFGIRPAEKVAVPLPGEGVACAVLVSAGGRERICGLGERTGRLFVLDIESGDVKTIEPVSTMRLFGRTMVVGPDDLVYGTGTEGELWRCDPGSGRLERLDVFIPTIAGRELKNHADSLAVDRVRGLVYGGGTADGIMFSFEPATGRVRSLGKPTCYRGVPAMEVTNDGRVFGISGRRGDLARLFCYDPAEHEMRDLGVPVAVFGPRVYGYEFSCSAVGRDGQIFLGQHERGGHLWVYWPAVRP